MRVLQTLVVISLTSFGWGWCQTETPTQVSQDVSVTTERLSVKYVEQMLREVGENVELEEDKRKQIIAAYQATLGDLKSADEMESRAQAISGEAASVPSRTEQTKQQLDEIKKIEPTVDKNVPLPELEQLLSKLELQLVSQKTARAAVEAEAQTRAQRRKEIRTRLVAIQERLAELKQQVVGATAETTPIDSAKAMQPPARRRALEQERSLLENELAKFDAEEVSGLLRLKIDLATQQTTMTEKTIVLLREKIKIAREAGAEESVRQARRDSINADPLLKGHAEHNQRLAETAKMLAGKLAEAELDLKSAKEAQDQLRRQFEQTRQKVEVIGLTSSVGALLRKQRLSLPDVRQRKTAISARQPRISDTQYELFEYQDERQALVDCDAWIQTIVRDAKSSDTRDTELLTSAARDLLGRKCEYLDALIRTCGQYFDTLIELDSTDQQVVTLTASYTKFIDERVLWIRSGRLITHDFRIDSVDASLLNPLLWKESATQIAGDARRNWPLYALALVLLGIGLLRKKRQRAAITSLGEVAQRGSCRIIGPTIQAAVLTVLTSIVWPVFFALVSWRLYISSGDSEFTKTVSCGLFSTAIVWAPLEFFRQVCRKKGLGEAHFGWSAGTNWTMRWAIRWAVTIGLPLVFVTETLMASEMSHGRDTFERLAFTAGMLLLAVLLFVVLRPKGFLRDYFANQKGGWIDRLKPVWCFGAACIPMTLAALAVTGYYYTSQVLAWRLFATCCFLLLLVIARAVFLRMLLMRRRHLSIEQARQRASNVTADDGLKGVAQQAGIVTNELECDITAQSLQSKKLVNAGLLAVSLVGLWLIWVQVLPALGMLDKYPLWNTASVQPLATAAADTSTAPLNPVAPNSTAATEPEANSQQATTITLSDLFFAVLIAFVTFVLFRNGPGLLELSILQRLPFEASVRYAITTLVSYAIVMIGLIVACSTIGLRWSQIQWLATALTFGLAFGLQEMFANFVAGLIILLERPIRVGDIVTVDDVTGIVSRIRIRATSITNWDRKEYVVPNKEFITGRLLNWTLSDRVNRVVVTIGVAYGSDTDRAREILLDVANEHPMVLKDPPSVATFESFGDNSLNLVLRAFLPTPDNRLEVIHQLHTAIDKAFRREGIEIAFPQRDLHIRSAPPALALAFDQVVREQSSREEAA